MSDIPPVGTLLGNLVIDELFIDYDGPKLFTCFDEYGSFYLAVFADEDDDAEIYLYAELSPAQLDILRTGQISIREVFKNPLYDNLWIVRRSLTTTEGVAEQVSPEAINENWLPSQDARLPAESIIGVADGPKPDSDTPRQSGRFGEPNSIDVQFYVPDDPSQGFSLANVSIYVGGIEVVPHSSVSENEDVPPIALRQILHGLARAWPFLEWEESSPWGLPAESLTELLEEARTDEQSAPSDLRREREERNRDYIHRHDLARILRGSGATSVLALRKGREFGLLSRTGSWTVEATAFLESLEKLGDAFASHASTTGDLESRDAADAWRKKRSLRPLRIAEISTGISSAELRLIEQNLGDNSLWIAPDDPASNELYAAARMTASLGVEQIAQIVAEVSSTPRVTTEKLDAASDEADCTIGEGAVDFETGYELADWYRRHHGLARDESVNPEQHLRSLDVTIRNAALSSEVDAVAVWGPNHGPCVIVNLEGDHSRSAAGRRMTLAHELGHLLLDRDGALPVAEVLGGRISESVESRARAFAAELLLPRKTAADAYAASPDNPDEVVSSLCSDYGVSREAAAWQIRNSGVRLTARGRSVLRSYVTDPGSF